MTTLAKTLEAGNTFQFTWVSSVAPDSAPLFSVTDQGAAVVCSVSAIQSGSTAYYALYTTAANSDGRYRAEWLAVKTVNGSAYNLINRFGFVVAKTPVTP